jgi:hypothetical protein
VSPSTLSALKAIAARRCLPAETYVYGTSVSLMLCAEAYVWYSPIKKSFLFNAERLEPWSQIR